MNDFSQPISDEGREIQHKMNLILKEQGVQPDCIWHSPLLRAKETAKIIAKDFQAPLQEENALGSFFDEHDFIEKFPDPSKNALIFLVGHGPPLQKLFSYLVQNHEPSPIIQNSAVLILEFPDSITPGSAIFLGYLSPNFYI